MSNRESLAVALVQRLALAPLPYSTEENAKSFARVRDEAQTILLDTVYTGHAGNGGLQRHSIGSTYPWTVIARGGEPTEYAAFHCFTQQQGAWHATCRQAHEDAAYYARRDVAVAAVHDAGGTFHVYPPVAAFNSENSR